MTRKMVRKEMPLYYINFIHGHSFMSQTKPRWAGGIDSYGVCIELNLFQFSGY